MPWDCTQPGTIKQPGQPSPYFDIQQVTTLVDVVPPEKRSAMMSGIRGSNTKPEVIVRKALFAAGYRYRLHRKDLPGRPDVVMSGRRVSNAILMNPVTVEALLTRFLCDSVKVAANSGHFSRPRQYPFSAMPRRRL